MPAGAAHVDPGRRPPDAAAAGLRARHSLSQNFLADPDVLDAILAEAQPVPGPAGARDRAGARAADERAARRPARIVTAVELDRGLAAFLRDRFAPEIADGAAPARRGRRARPGPRRASCRPPYDVVANLPYHITSPILHRLLGETPRPERLVLMVQREVAERIAAPPGEMSYLCVFVQYHARVRIAVDVPPRGVRAGARRSARR